LPKAFESPLEALTSNEEKEKKKREKRKEWEWN
jgi:hypothetical protein